MIYEEKMEDYCPSRNGSPKAFKTVVTLNLWVGNTRVITVLLLLLLFFFFFIQSYLLSIFEGFQWSNTINFHHNYTKFDLILFVLVEHAIQKDWHILTYFYFINYIYEVCKGGHAFWSDMDLNFQMGSRGENGNR